MRLSHKFIDKVLYYKYNAIEINENLLGYGINDNLFGYGINDTLLILRYKFNGIETSCRRCTMSSRSSWVNTADSPATQKKELVKSAQSI